MGGTGTVGQVAGAAFADRVFEVLSPGMRPTEVTAAASVLFSRKVRRERPDFESERFDVSS